MKSSLYILLLSLVALISNHAETIEITDNQGRSFTANLVKSDGKTIDVVRTSDSRNFTLSLDSLDKKTRDSISSWVGKGGNLSRDFEISMNTGKTSRTTEKDDFDDKRVNLSPVVTVRNPNASQETMPLEMTVLFFGRPVESTTDIYVFRKQTFEMPKLDPLDSKDFVVEAISQAYDNRGSAKFGARYLGYAWIIHDSTKSEIVACSSVPTSLAATHESAILKLDADSSYTKDLIPIPKLRPGMR